MKPLRIVCSLLAVSVFSFAACGIESQEATFKYRLQSMDELAAKAADDLKATIAAEKARYEEAYAKLPAEEDPRGEMLGRLNIESRAFITQMTKKLDELAGAEKERLQAGEKQEFAARLERLSGDWQGTGIRLLITPDGTIEYERVAGGVKKSITGGTVTRIGDNSFDVKVLLGTTTFRLDELPRRDGAYWKMKVDGIEVIRK